MRIKRNKQKGPFLSRLPSLTINGENRSSQDAKREGALTATLNPIHNTIIMGCVRPFKEGIGFSHHTGVCSKGQTHNLIPSVLKRNRVQILYKKGLRFFQGFSPVGVWLFSLWGTSLFTIRSGDLRGVVGSPCTYNIKLKFWVTYILFVWYYTFSTTFQVRLLF